MSILCNRAKRQLAFYKSCCYLALSGDESVEGAFQSTEAVPVDFVQISFIILSAVVGQLRLSAHPLVEAEPVDFVESLVEPKAVPVDFIKVPLSVIPANGMHEIIVEQAVFVRFCDLLATILVGHGVLMAI